MSPFQKPHISSGRLLSVHVDFSLTISVLLVAHAEFLGFLLSTVCFFTRHEKINHSGDNSSKHIYHTRLEWLQHKQTMNTIKLIQNGKKRESVKPAAVCRCCMICAILATYSSWIDIQVGVCYDQYIKSRQIQYCHIL